MKILLATPLLEGASPNYIRSLCGMLSAELPDIELDYMVSDCGCISFARNDIGWEAEKGGFDKVVMVDEDMLYTPENFLRLVSHDVDLIAAPYCKRRPGKPHYLFVPLEGAKVESDGKLECVRVATGLECIKVSALTKLRSAFPELEFLAQDSAGGPVETRMNFFPMGVVGPRTAEARLDKIKSVLKADFGSDSDSDEQRLADIRAIISEDQPAGSLRGEDYYICDLMRRAGMHVYVDVGLPLIPHVGHIAFPITPEMVGFTPGQPITLPKAEKE